MTDHALLDDFIVETSEHLEGTERNLLLLEQRSNDPGVLDEIFRAIHTIKGSSEYLGLDRIGALSHKLENLLDFLRRGERALDSDGIDVLIDANDRLGRLLDDLVRHKAERVAIDDCLERIDAYIGNAKPITAEEATGETAVAADEDGFGDEYDEELFGIFVGQLKEGLQALLTHTRRLLAGDPAEAVLGRYQDQLDTLRTSANYMGYDNLKQLYSQWSETVDRTGGRLAEGRPVDWAVFSHEVTDHYVGRIKEMFAKVADLGDLPAAAPAEPQSARSDSQTTQPSQLFGFDTIGIEMTDGGSSPAELSAADRTDDDGAAGADSHTDLTGPPDHALLDDFIVETGEHLESMEHGLLLLEAHPGDSRVLNEIFRSVHTIKGSSEYLGLARIGELSHKLENLLDLLRRGERVLDSGGIDVLIGANDRLGQLLDDLMRHKAERAAIDDCLENIDAYIGNAKPITAEEATGEAAAAVEQDGFGDEYDEELFGIFVGQLREGLQALQAHTRQIQSGDPAEEVLGHYQEQLNTLRASANYMGYDNLKQLYSQWSEMVADVGSRLAGDQPVDWDAFSHDVTDHYVARITEMLARVADWDDLHATEAAEPRAAVPEAMDAVSDRAEPVARPQEAAAPDNHDLLDDFVLEAGEHLEIAERNLLNLGSHPDDVQSLNELFRAIHTIKGASEYLGLARIAELAHRVESLLERMRHGQRSLDSAVADLLMAANDRIALLVNDLAHHGREQAAIDDLVAGIVFFVEAPLPEATEGQPGPIQSAEDESRAFYQETYDDQLFAIFMDHFNEGMAALDEYIGQAASGEDLLKCAEGCKAWLQRLRSSANYMEYGELKTEYDRWLGDLQNLTECLAQEDPACWTDAFRQTMQPHMDTVRRFFALSEGLHAMDDQTGQTVSPCSDGAMAAPEDPGADSEVSTMEPSEDSAEALGLMSRLESTFSAKIGLGVDRDHDVAVPFGRVDELFSSDGDAAMPTAAGAHGDGLTFMGTGAATATGDIEAQLFSDPTSGGFAQHILPADTLERMDSETPTVSVATDGGGERRGSFIPGRRRTDKLGERLTKPSIRVDAAKIDTLMNQVGELVVNRSGFNQIFFEMRELQLLLKQLQRLDTREMKIVKDLTNRINEATVSLGRVTSELQENVMKVRMLPISQLFSRYPRVVHDLVRNTDKKVSLVIRGEETELDRMVIEQLADPLIHIIRNAVDHGIETVTERQRKGKPETGTLRLEAYHEGNFVVIEVSDDGHGIDTGKILGRAIEKGFVEAEAAQHMSENQVRALIMRPGFSTADEVTHTSGRGVGMDVVKESIESLNGSIEILSTPGIHSLFRIRIPLTLAIIQALLVRVSDAIYAIPLTAVDETLRIHQNEIATIEGVEVYYLRETTLPLIRLAEVFRMRSGSSRGQELFVVVINTGSRQVGLIVDQLQGRQEVVIKPLEDYIQEKSGFSGATLLGDGRIALILDVAELVQLAIARQARKLRAVAV